MSNCLKWYKLLLGIFILSIPVFIPSCGVQNKASNSRITTVNMPHTDVKKQSIGNCWIYAALGWVESLVLKTTGGRTELNLSETYLTYRDFENKLVYGTPSEIQTGGSFGYAMNLINLYGVMNEGDFIPGEADSQISAVQAKAEKDVNESLKSGAFAKLSRYSEGSKARSQLVTKELTRIFGINWQEVNPKIINPNSINAIHYANGTNISLGQLAAKTQYRWTEYAFPSSVDKPSSTRSLPVNPRGVTAAQQAALKRIFVAMNSGYPVLISWFVDFNARKDGVFSSNTLKDAGMGRQGYHITVLEDYVVHGTNPSTGKPFQIGEGEVSPELKQLAANFGKLDYFVTKNSWGTLETNTYKRDGQWGYSKLQADYLFSWLGEKAKDSTDIKDIVMGLNGFVVPPGF